MSTFDLARGGHSFPESGSPPPLFRPTAIHPVAKPPGLFNKPNTRVTSIEPAYTQDVYLAPTDEGKLSVSIDFGTFSLHTHKSLTS
jgi:hypothetical protein